ncbi:MAG: AAA family ATPase [Acetobacteraceae bacterium]|nr:AAA family ATPase [Acetobacteraceae bacterium]
MQRGLTQMTLVRERDVSDPAGQLDPDLAEPRSYLELYGFGRPPFAADAPQGGFVLGESHRIALETLAGAILAGRSDIVLTGEAQIGKTSLLDTVIALVARRGVRVSRIGNKRPGPLSLKRLLSQVIGIDEPATLEQADSARAHAILTTPLQDGSHAVLAIDDADTLSVGALRYLTQLRRRGMSGPQLVFVGAPPVWPLLRQGEFRPLTQRIGVRLRINRLTGEEVRAYIERRLWMAGSETRKVLAQSAVAEIVVRTEGIPGRINAALDRVFAVGFEHGHARITPLTVRAALGVTRPPTIRPAVPQSAPPIWLIAGASLALGVAAAIYANWAALPDTAQALAWFNASQPSPPPTPSPQR